MIAKAEASMTASSWLSVNRTRLGVRSRAEGTRLKFGGQQRGGIIRSAFASQITGSDVLEVFEAEIDRRSASQADAIAFDILGEWERRVMTLWMIAAED